MMLCDVVSSGSAVTCDTCNKLAETLDGNIDYVSVVRFFSTGIACGILFSFLMFILSILINCFFDIIKK